MKYRKSYFSSLLATDYAKLTYLEWLFNSFTEWYIDVFLCDVMEMTTRQWLSLPIVFFVALPLFPIAIYFDMKDIRKMAIKKTGGWISYEGVYIYWRDVSDFNSTPTSYLLK